MTDYSIRELAAAVMQARLSWPAADRLAAELDNAGLLRADGATKGTHADRTAAVLSTRLPAQQAEDLASDLLFAGLLAANT